MTRPSKPVEKRSAEAEANGSDLRSVEREVAAGTTETTPVAILAGVAAVDVLLALLALALAALAYVLA